jgi:hypothetical protein
MLNLKYSGSMIASGRNRMAASFPGKLQNCAQDQTSSVATTNKQTPDLPKPYETECQQVCQ